MIREKYVTRYKLCFIWILFLVSCTNNPLWEDEIKSKPPNIIKGNVFLSDFSTPKGVYVWFEGFDLGTYTDEEGKFEITLPPPKLQAGEGITGTFKVYYYMANYQMDSSFVVLKSGEIQRLKGDIDKDGNIRQSIYLFKTLSLKTKINPRTVLIDNSGSIMIQATLTPEVDSVFIEYPDSESGPLSIIFLKRIFPNEDYVDIINLANNSTDEIMIADTLAIKSKDWTTILNLKKGQLPRGIYEIIPYFLITSQKTPPAELLNNFGRFPNKPKPEFLNVPFKRELEDIEIKEAS